MSFGRFLLKRVLQGVLVIWGVITVVFLLRFITPGSPVNVVAPLDASPELRARIAAEYGLNQPLYVQYLDYLVNLLQFDMGYSYIFRQDAAGLIFARLPATVELAVAATVVAVVLSIPLGVVSATRRHQPADYSATTFSLLGISTPNFWLGIMLLLVLGVQYNLFPIGNRGPPFVEALGALLGGNPSMMVTWLSFIALPAITLGTYFTALITRLTRSGMLDELGKSYVRAARAKGIPETLVRYRHALRNTLIPVITVVGLQLGTLIGGAVITETVFNWNGLGELVINAVYARDWPVLQGSLIVIGIGFVLVNIVVDALYAYLDPRVIE